MSDDVKPMFTQPPKVTVNEYKSLDDELMALSVGMFVMGRDSHDWVEIDVNKEVLENTAPTNVAMIKQAFEKWCNHEHPTT